jgi:hypothetical protein
MIPLFKRDTDEKPTLKFLYNLMQGIIKLLFYCCNLKKALLNFKGIQL